MELKHGIQLAYCTNIHRGETWPETLAALTAHTLEVKRRVAPRQPYAIGLRLGGEAVRALGERQTRLEFQRWMEKHDCYVFTINGFPYGKFHGTRVKEQVYAPDWTTPERLAYTNLLFDLLAQLVPDGVDGSVSTVPVSFKGFKLNERQVRPTAMAPVWRMAAFALGAGTALMGDKAAHACTEAVETVIEEHYGDQVAELAAEGETHLAGRLAQFRDEEIAHKDLATAEGAAEAPGYRLLSGLIRTGCRMAIRISEKV